MLVKVFDVKFISTRVRLLRIFLVLANFGEREGVLKVALWDRAARIFIVLIDLEEIFSGFFSIVIKDWFSLCVRTLKIENFLSIIYLGGL